MNALRFDPICEGDLTLLHEWLWRPHIAEWWGPAETVAELRAKYLGDGSGRGPEAYIVRLASRPIGFIQSYVVMSCGGVWWEGETDPGARGIDQFLAEAGELGRGLGSAVLRAFLERIFADPTVTVVQTDPHPANIRAIRCYTRCGFVPVGEVETPDGRALLMRCSRQRVPPLQGSVVI